MTILPHLTHQSSKVGHLTHFPCDRALDRETAFDFKSPGSRIYANCRSLLAGDFKARIACPSTSRGPEPVERASRLLHRSPDDIMFPSEDAASISEMCGLALCCCPSPMDFHEHPFAAEPVELAVEKSVPMGPKSSRPSVTATTTSRPMMVRFRWASALSSRGCCGVSAVRFLRRESLEPLLEISVQAGFIVVDEHRGRDVHAFTRAMPSRIPLSEEPPQPAG